MRQICSEPFSQRAPFVHWVLTFFHFGEKSSLVTVFSAGQLEEILRVPK